MKLLVTAATTVEKIDLIEDRVDDRVLPAQSPRIKVCSWFETEGQSHEAKTLLLQLRMKDLNCWRSLHS